MEGSGFVAVPFLRKKKSENPKAPGLFHCYVFTKGYLTKTFTATVFWLLCKLMT